MKENTRAYPLTWPDGKPRTQFRRTNGHFRKSFATARDECLAEIRRLGGSDPVISTNIPLKRDGQTPYATKFGETLPDPGVAVYFTRNKRQMCFACDCWHHIQDNMHAITLTISALRGIARWGTGDMMEAAFRGFTAIPERSSQSWHSVLGVAINASREQVRSAYADLCKKHHPDVGGDSVRFREISEAWKQFNQEHGG